MRRLVMLHVLAVFLMVFPAGVRADPLAGHAKVETLVKSPLMWNGDLLPHYADGQPEITILRFEIPPGTSLPLHVHPYANAGVLLSGELVVHAEDGSSRHLKAGDTLIELVNIRHYGSNDGAVPAVILVFYAGIQGESVTRIIAREPPAGEPSGDGVPHGGGTGHSGS
ncbi:MAG: cupin domain-containing protein [Halieaceae bacterium]|uniref:cupin domain-containing protein n=1 Tax=Haliea alexandrii TaxID=2448162 RepID=UPI000F0B5507|nr:cupin domain-containing protein [Haliea alexandrii]MCR9186793.1 cupin domain-containing protein [Halieaceae bacterium]